MCKIPLYVFPVFLSLSLFAQNTKHNADGSYYRRCSSFSVSKPLSELVAEHNAKITGKEHVENRQADDSVRYEKLKSYSHKKLQNIPVLDGARQSNQGKTFSPAPFVNIDGQQSTLGLIPLDPNGMIGSNYYVQTVNVNYAVYDKNGQIKLQATDFDYLFPGTFDYGDPVTVYDKFADRWLITEIGDGFDTLNIAVSATNDPTGSYYIYKFAPIFNDFVDYPKYTVWADGYYQTCNCFMDNVTVYERDKMLAGDSTAGFIVIPWNNNPWEVGNAGGTGTGDFFCPMTLNADGQLPPYGTPNYLFYYTDDNWGLPYKDAIIINKVSVDWTTQSGVITVDDTLPVAPFDSYFSGVGGRSDIDQPNDRHSLDAVNGFVAYRPPYIRWPDYNTALMCCTVNVDTTNLIAGIRWYELRQNLQTMKWSVYQQSTYAPADGISRWNPSIAMDENGSIALAYSVSDSNSVYPGCRYTGRRSCDSLNQMSLTEITACKGDTDAFTNFRWGDYSLLSVDPTDGKSFWCTNMYAHSGYGMQSNVGTRIFAFTIPKCIANSSSSAQGTYGISEWRWLSNSWNRYLFVSNSAS